ncbi:MAG TPA: hypothetical protein VLE23_09950 [Geminicoccaceae bacterium]|nr:hypothetical protein [Geminicoccaceae bacterium]
MRLPTAFCAAALVLAPIGAPVAAAGGAVADLRAFAATADAEVERLGRRIWLNEAAGRHDRLVHWLPGETHLSLGVGHVIWYPAGARGRFHESFPDLLAYLRQRGVSLPAWLTPGDACPWRNRAEFLAATADPRLMELRDFLAATVAEQAAFLIERLAAALPEILAAAPEQAARAGIAERLARILYTADGSISPAGVYALVDYVNFKGEGTRPAERYQGEGWGLLQVLEAMADRPGEDLAAFADAAAAVLTRRVALAPGERREARWLGGWLKRVASYADGRRFEAEAAANPPAARKSS